MEEGGGGDRCRTHRPAFIIYHIQQQQVTPNNPSNESNKSKEANEPGNNPFDLSELLPAFPSLLNGEPTRLCHHTEQERSKVNLLEVRGTTLSVDGV
jgi:hypothetical protein